MHSLNQKANMQVQQYKCWKDFPEKIKQNIYAMQEPNFLHTFMTVWPWLHRKLGAENEDRIV